MFSTGPAQENTKLNWKVSTNMTNAIESYRVSNSQILILRKTHLKKVSTEIRKIETNDSCESQEKPIKSIEYKNTNLWPYP